MIRIRTLRQACISCGVLGFVATASLAAQGTVTASAVSLPTPTLARYDTLYSAPGSVAITGDCANASNDCSLKLTSIVSGIEWQIVSAPGNCQGAMPLNVWSSSATATLTGIKHLKNCIITINFRLSGLSFAAHQAPTTYNVGSASFLLTSP